MSDTLRYLNDSGKVVEGEAANAFLQNKLRDGMAGRYTQQQIDRLNQSGGPAVVNSADGSIPTGPAYPQNNYLNEPEGSSSEETGHTGAMSPEEIREKFGLKFDEKHSKMEAPGAYSRDTGGDGFAHDNGAIFTQDGRYVGSVKGDGDEEYYAGYKSLTDAASPYKEKEEGKGFSSVDSLSDVAGAVRFLTDGEAKKEAKVEKKPDPIRHSPELKQAVERVRTYENDVFSGKISDDIFGQGTYGKVDGYNFDYNKGADGIGTAGGSVSNVEAKAADNFLDSQKTKIKKDYNFRPVDTSKYAYGAN